MTGRARHACVELGLVSVLFAFVGCRDSAASGTTPASVTSSPATVPATDAPNTDSPTTTTPVGSTGPATTVGPPVDPSTEKAIKQGVQDYFAAYWACGQAPAQCHPADFHSSRGTAAGQGTVYFQGLAARGEYFAPDLRGSYVVTQSIALDDPASAVTFSCWYDASIVLGPVGADGQPAVLNDKVISVRQQQTLYFDGVAWKVGEDATVQDLGEGNQCPPPDANVSG